MKKPKLPAWLVFWLDKNDPANFDSGYAGYGNYSKIGKRRAITEAVLFSLSTVIWYYVHKIMRCLQATHGPAYAYVTYALHSNTETASKHLGKFPDVYYKYYAEAERHPWRLLLPVLVINLKTVMIDGQDPSERFYGRQFPKPFYWRALGK